MIFVKTEMIRKTSKWLTGEQKKENACCLYRSREVENGRSDDTAEREVKKMLDIKIDQK